MPQPALRVSSELAVGDETDQFRASYKLATDRLNSVRTQARLRVRCGETWGASASRLTSRAARARTSAGQTRRMVSGDVAGSATLVQPDLPLRAGSAWSSHLRDAFPLLQSRRTRPAHVVLKEEP